MSLGNCNCYVTKNKVSITGPSNHNYEHMCNSYINEAFGNTRPFTPGFLTMKTMHAGVIFVLLFQSHAARYSLVT